MVTDMSCFTYPIVMNAALFYGSIVTKWRWLVVAVWSWSVGDVCFLFMIWLPIRGPAVVELNPLVVSLLDPQEIEP